MSVKLSRTEFRIFLKPKLWFQSSGLWIQKQKFPGFRMIIDCGQSIFYFDLVRGVHAHARRKKRGEKRASPISRLQSRAWSFIRLARFARRTKMKERLPYMGRRIHKVGTYGEKKGKGSAQRRERRTHTLLSLRSW